MYLCVLEEKEEHDVDCGFVNTGWTGGPYGEGKRIPISVTRKIIDSIHNGNLAAAELFVHRFTGFKVPIVPDDFIPAEMLEPEKGWDDIIEYKEKVSSLIADFSSKANN